MMDNSSPINCQVGTVFCVGLAEALTVLTGHDSKVATTIHVVSTLTYSYVVTSNA